MAALAPSASLAQLTQRRQHAPHSAKSFSGQSLRFRQRLARAGLQQNEVHGTTGRPSSTSPISTSPSSSSSNSVAADFLKGVTAVAATAVVLGSSLSLPALAEDAQFTIYYGTAASASSYGGYGGNADKQYTAEYVYDVPEGWKERQISKVEKGTNGTDSEFYNPKKKTEKTYLLFLAGFRRLPPKDDVLNNIALSDVDLQDLIASADSIEFAEQEKGSQQYYEFEIDSPAGHALIFVTSSKNKLYSHFVNAAPAEWKRDEAILRHIHSSFKTVGGDPLSPPGQF